MLPFLFRIGPIFIAQILFSIAGCAQILIRQFLPCYACYGYTFIQLAIQLFLIEMIIVFRLINKNKQLRMKYISKLVFGTNQYYKLRFGWNIFCIGAVILGLISWMIREGILLSDSELRNSEKIFTLYPLCFFADQSNHPESSNQLSMVLNFLYACNVLMNIFLIALSIRSFYAYIQKIKRNRRFFIQNSMQSSQSFIDCQIINQVLNKSLIGVENSRDCGICLRKLSGQKIIRLRCSHFFHQQCISEWLYRKDECPYRCI